MGVGGPFRLIEKKDSIEIIDGRHLKWVKMVLREVVKS